MRALSIRQPFAELILRGIKTIEYRTRPTRIIGERFHIYASKGRETKRRRDEETECADDTTSSLRLSVSSSLRSDNIVVPTETPPWMLELANALKLFPHELPTGVIVGSAVIEKVSRLESFGGDDGMWQWHLVDVERAKRLRKPTGHPQPVWFNPF